MKKYNLLVFCGESGAGKNRLLTNLVKQNPDKFHCLISHTTRPAREREIDGLDYYFVTEAEYHNLDFLESTCFNGWYYGTAKNSLKKDKINVGVLNLQGIMQLQKREDINLKVFYLQVSEKTRLVRQLSREENPDVREILRRFSTDLDDFDDYLKYIDYEILPNETPQDLAASITRLKEINFD